MAEEFAGVIQGVITVGWEVVEECGVVIALNFKKMMES